MSMDNVTFLEMGRSQWRTKDGRVLLWREMDNQHLKNTAVMLRRRADQLKQDLAVADCCLQGDAAQDALASCAADIEEDTTAMRQLAGLMESYLAARVARLPAQPA